jgi:hypothetical protein
VLVAVAYYEYPRHDEGLKRLKQALPNFTTGDEKGSGVFSTERPGWHALWPPRGKGSRTVFLLRWLRCASVERPAFLGLKSGHAFSDDSDGVLAGELSLANAIGRQGLAATSSLAIQDDERGTTDGHGLTRIGRQRPCK